MKIFIGKDISCALNYQHDFIVEYLAERLEIIQNVHEADIIVFPSSCSATEDVILNTINYIDKVLSEKKEGCKTFLTGCLTRRFKENVFLSKVEEWLKRKIDYIIPLNDPIKLLQCVSDQFTDLTPGEFGYAKPYYDTDEIRLYIGNGCLNKCAFCKLTYQNFPLTSVDMEEIKSVIDYANSLNVRKIYLLATNLSQYGLDLYKTPMLPYLVEYIEGKENIESLGLVGFSYKDAINYGFASALANASKLNYISGSLETGSPRLLEIIGNYFTKEQFINFIIAISNKYQKFLDVNIISGLPTETIDDIKETLEVLRIIMPYSVEICEYVNSSFLPLNNYPQLTDREIKNHAKIYNEVLRRKNIKTHIVRK